MCDEHEDGNNGAFKAQKKKGCHTGHMVYLTDPERRPGSKSFCIWEDRNLL